jgi:MFS family permease
MSVIVYACALVGINFFARIGDKINRRGLPLLAASACASLGFILLLAVTNLKGRMAATCILAFGIYATIPLSTTWLTLNIGGYTQRGAATAMMNMIAQAFSISGNQAYIDPPICESFFMVLHLSVQALF